MLQNSFYLDIKGNVVEKETLISDLPDNKIIIFTEVSSPPVAPSVDTIQRQGNTMQDYTDFYCDHEKHFELCSTHLENLSDNYRAAMTFYRSTQTNKANVDSLSEMINEFNTKQTNFLLTFENDLENLKNVPLDPALQTLEFKTLHDVVAPEQLREHKNEFEEDLTGLMNVVSALPKNKQQFLHDKFGDFLQRKDAELQKLQKLENFRNSILDNPSRTAEDEYSYISLAEKYATVSAQITQILNEALLYMHENIQPVFILRKNVKKISQLRRFFEKLQISFFNLQYPKKAPVTYQKGLCEITRRLRFKHWFLQQLHQANLWISDTFREEEKIRKNFLLTHGRTFPIKLAPALRESTPDWSIRCPEFDLLPNVSFDLTNEEIPEISFAPLINSKKSDDEENKTRELSEKLARISREYELLVAEKEDLVAQKKNAEQEAENYKELCTSQHEKSLEIEAELKTECAQLQEIIESHKNTISQLQENVVRLTNENISKLEESSVEVSSLTQRHQTLENNFNQLTIENNTQKQEIAQVKEQLQKEQQNNENLKLQITSFENAFAELRAEKLSVSANFTKLQEDVKNLTNEIDTISAEKISLHDLLEAEKQRSKKLEQENSNNIQLAEQLQNSLGDAKSNVLSQSQLQERVEELERENNSLLAEKRNFMQEIRKFEDLSQSQLQKQSSEELESLVTGYRLQIQDLDENIKQLNDFNRQITRQKLEAQNLITQLQGNLVQQQEENERLRNFNATLKDNLRENTYQLNALEDELHASRMQIQESVIMGNKKKDETSLIEVKSKISPGDTVLVVPRGNGFVAVCDSSKLYFASPDCVQQFQKPIGSVYLVSVLCVGKDEIASLRNDPYKVGAGNCYCVIDVSLV